MSIRDSKIIPLSRLRGDTAPRSRKKSTLGRTRNLDVLMEAQRCYDNMSRYRYDRRRNRRYVYGDQWGDMIDTDCGKITEEAYIRSQGNIPLKNNLMRRLVRAVVGVYRNQTKEPICVARDRDEQQLGETMSVMLQYNMQLNRATEINARTFEEFLIGGMAVQRKWYGLRDGKVDCWTDYVQPEYFFIDSNMRDFRGWDCRMVGEVHDLSFSALCARLAHSAADVQRLTDIYRDASTANYVSSYYAQFGYDFGRSYSFFVPDDPTLCRVIEVWKKEAKPRYLCHDWATGEIYLIDLQDFGTAVQEVNDSRLRQGVAAGMSEEDIPLIEAEYRVDDYWQQYLLSPLGDVLQEQETPYEHKSHPYVFKAYPFIDGEIHSFAGDFIDQQRYVNRLITMYDWIMRTSAKGVLMFPEESLPAGMDMNDIAEAWTKIGGVVLYKAKAGVPAPQQIATNMTNIGIGELLNLELRFFEEISGVQGALQGKPGSSGMAASLYAQQAQNATVSISDLLDTYSSFIIDGAYKDVHNMQQFYDDKKYVSVAGKKSVVEYNPKDMDGVEFDLSIQESTQTPVYREIANEFLMQIWQRGQIGLEQLLEVGDFPFADRLLQVLQAQKEQMEKGQQPEGMPADLQQQVAQSGNPEAVQQAYEMLQQQAQAPQQGQEQQPQQEAAQQ